MNFDGFLNDTKKKQISSFYDVFGTNRQLKKSPIKKKLQPLEDLEDIYVDLNIKLIFAKIDNKMLAIVHLYDDEMILLLKKVIKIFDFNG